MSLYITADGSHTVISNKYNVPYHSIHGALEETNHVFITNGLLRCTGDQLRILEIGLGTGLNALATFQTNKGLKKKIDYHAIEAFPLSSDIVDQLNYGTYFTKTEMKVLDQIHNASSEESSDLDPNFTFVKYLQKLESWNSDYKYDLVYFDAFAPSAQPELWTKVIFKKLYNLMRNGASLVTYCAKGQVKRDLRSIGFEVQSLPGPPRKREMTRAIR